MKIGIDIQERLALAHIVEWKSYHYSWMIFFLYCLCWMYVFPQVLKTLYMKRLET